MQTSEKGKNFIKGYEKYSSVPYIDATGNWTVGWGHKIGKNPPSFKWISPDQGEAYFNNDLKIAENCLNKFKLTQNQFDALMSFTFNCGVGAFLRNIAPLLKEGKLDEIPAVLVKFCHGDGKVLPGLLKRRQEEIRIFKT